MSLNIKITSNAAEALKKLEAFPAVQGEAIIAAVNRQNQLAIGSIVRNRLTGKGPFAPSLHKLGVVTNRLRNSLYSTASQKVGNSIVSAIGTNVEYAGVHEFGFDGTVFVNSHERKAHKRLKEIITTKLGKQRRKFTKVGGSIVTGHGREMHMPARAPIKTGLEDVADSYGRGLSRAIVEAWEKHMGK